MKKQTWCSHFCTGSSHFLCSTRYQFPQVELGSTSTWDTCCASSCPWHRARNGLRSCLRIRHIFSRRGCQLSPGVAGHYYLGSPWSKRREKHKARERDRRRKKELLGSSQPSTRFTTVTKCLDQPKYQRGEGGGSAISLKVPPTRYHSTYSPCCLKLCWDLSKIPNLKTLPLRMPIKADDTDDT